jgi:4-amino-4-deoxy-L-arabinose transferase-like glycosyltransferase
MDSRTIRKILCSLGLGLYLSLFAVLNLYLLDQHPLVNVDEPWLSDAALNFTRTGHFTPTMFRGMHYNLEGKYQWSFYDLLLAAVFKIFGFGLYQARFLSFLSGVSALALLFLLGKQLYNSQVGILAAILFAFSPIYHVGRIARPEMLLTAFTLAALYLCFLGLQRDSPIFYCLSGLISLLSGDVHLNGVMVLATVGILCLTQPKTSLMKGRAVGFYLLGVIVGVIYWLLAHGPILTELAIEGYVGSSLISSWAFMQLKLQYFGSYFHGGSFQYVSVLSSFMLVSLVGIGIRRQAADTFLLTSIAAFIPFYLFVFVNTLSLYLAYLFPLLYLAVSAFIYDSIQSTTRSSRATTMMRKRGLVGVGMLIILLGLAMAKGIAEIKEGLRYRNAGGYDGYIEKLKVYIPANAVVMGQPTWFYGFYTQPYYADRYFAWIAHTRHDQVREKLGRSFKEAIEQAGVEYLLVDDRDLYDRMLRRREALNSLPVNEAIAFLQEKCVVAGEVEDEFYGFTRVYKVKTDIQ